MSGPRWVSEDASFSGRLRGLRSTRNINVIWRFVAIMSILYGRALVARWLSSMSNWFGGGRTALCFSVES